MNDLRMWKLTDSDAVDWDVRIPEGIWTPVLLTVALSSAPTTDVQDFTLTIDSAEGAGYDVSIVTDDLVGDTGLVWAPAGIYPLVGATVSKTGDVLTAAFPNDDSRTVGIILWLKKLGSR